MYYWYYYYGDRAWSANTETARRVVMWPYIMASERSSGFGTDLPVRRRPAALDRPGTPGGAGVADAGEAR